MLSSSSTKQSPQLKFFKAYILIAVLHIAANNAHAQNIFDTSVIKPRFRVIIDNDFGGDPDGLFQLAHAMLSPSIEVRAVIGSHLNANDGFDRSKEQAQHAAQQAQQLLEIMKMPGVVPVIAGSNTAMVNDSTPVVSDGVNFIIKEAMRTDTKMPLFVVCGAGLTEIA